MKRVLSLAVMATVTTLFLCGQSGQDILSYRVDPQKIALYHQDSQGNVFGNFSNLRTWLKKQDKKLIFAMNGGMYLKDLSPQGLYIEQGRHIAPLNTIWEGYGNFYMQPNGIFFITKDGKARVTTTKDFRMTSSIKYATQSGPMLVIDGKLHHRFIPNSKHVHVRNGVGVLPDGKLLFAVSKNLITFYDFATFFKNQGCKNALYLDGFVSRVYLPEKNIADQDGVFGVIIAQTQEGK